MAKVKRHGFQNKKALNRKFRDIIKETPNSVGQAIEDSARAVHADAVARVPVDTGDLAESIEYKMSRDRLSAVVGPGAKAASVKKILKGANFADVVSQIYGSTKNGKRLLNFLKAVWVEFGTKGSNRHAPTPAQPFMRPAWDINRVWARWRIEKAVRQVFRRHKRK